MPGYFVYFVMPCYMSWFPPRLTNGPERHKQRLWLQEHLYPAELTAFGKPVEKVVFTTQHYLKYDQKLIEGRFMPSALEALRLIEEHAHELPAIISRETLGDYDSVISLRRLEIILFEDSPRWTYHIRFAGDDSDCLRILCMDGRFVMCNLSKPDKY